MPKSAAEIIREHQVQEVAKAAHIAAKAAKKEKHVKKEEISKKEDSKGSGLFGMVIKLFRGDVEKKQRLQHTKDVVDRVLSESGLLEEIENIKWTLMVGKFPKAELFVNYFESAAQIGLVWGEGFSLIKDKNGYYSDLVENEPYNYRLIGINIDTNNESFDVDNQHFTRFDRQIGRERLNYSLAREVLKAFPRVYSPPNTDYGDNQRGGRP